MYVFDFNEASDCTMKIKKINGDNYHRVFVVGDIHGEYDLLQHELLNANFNYEKDLLVSVGDLIDRGKSNIECLQLIREPWFESVLGNHEDMMINAVLHNASNYIDAWVKNGGIWYYSLDAEDKLLVDSLAKYADENVPHIIELSLNGKTIVVCHADYPSKHYSPNKAMDVMGLIWSRERMNQLNADIDNGGIDGADLFVFGHTVVHRVTQHHNCVWIDTGAVYGGELTMLSL